MAGPPQNIEPSALWRNLQKLPRPHEVVDYPRLDPKTGEPVGNVAVWVLTQEEQEAAAASAEQTTRMLLRRAGPDIPKEDEARSGYRDIYDNECAVELLWRALRDPESDKLTRPAFPSTRELRKLPSTEIAVLLNHYYEAQSRMGPIVSTMTEGEYKAWVEILAKGADGYPLSRLSWGARTALVLHLAKDAWKYLTGTSSSGPPPDDAPPNDPIPGLEPSPAVLSDTADEP